MKSAVIASALLASVALAAPVNKRAYATKTNTVVETVVVYTTVWQGDMATDAAAVPSSSQALFFENQPSSSAAVVTSEAVPSSTVEVVMPSSTLEPVVPSSTLEPVVPSSTLEPVIPSSTLAPVVETPAPTPTPEPTPEPSSIAPAPSSDPVPEPVPSSTAPAEPQPTEQSGGSGGGESYSGSLTMNYFSGGTGACGTAISDTDMTVALAVAGFGDSVFDPQTGVNINPWCNKKIRITYNGKSADATVMDRCPGCTGSGGLDATPALWDALTGGIGGASGDRLESGMTFTVVG